MILPHVTTLDLYGDGVAYEVVVMKRNKVNGDISYIRTDYLDDIDRHRIRKILQKRDAAKYEAWDLFAQVTLGNGMNALDYFHQAVKVLTKSGKIIAPSLYRAGAVQKPRLNPEPLNNGLVDNNAMVEEKPVRKAGRPPKANRD